MTERPRSKRPPARFVFWASVLLFAALFALLTFRFSAEQQVSAQEGRAVHVRKVVKRRVVTTIVPGAGESSVSSSPASSSSYVEEPEPVVTASS